MLFLGRQVGFSSRRRGWFWRLCSRRDAGGTQGQRGLGRACTQVVLSFKPSSSFPGQPRRELGFLFSQISESRACPASRLEKDMELVPHTLKQGKSLVVRRRNKTCLATCHFNENTNLSQVSIPHTPPLPPATRSHRPQVGAGRKTKQDLRPQRALGFGANI